MDDMRLIGEIDPARPLLVVAVAEEAAHLNGGLPVLLTGMGGQDSILFSATTIVNVESLQLEGGLRYDLITNDATVATVVAGMVTPLSVGVATIGSCRPIF